MTLNCNKFIYFNDEKWYLMSEHCYEDSVYNFFKSDSDTWCYHAYDVDKKYSDYWDFFYNNYVFSDAWKPKSKIFNSYEELIDTCEHLKHVFYKKIDYNSVNFNCNDSKNK